MQKKLGQYIWTLRQIEAIKEKLNNETVNSISDEITDNSVDGEGASDDGLQPSQNTLHQLQARLEDEFGNIDSEVLILTKQVCCCCCCFCWCCCCFFVSLFFFVFVFCFLQVYIVGSLLSSYP